MQARRGGVKEENDTRRCAGPIRLHDGRGELRPERESSGRWRLFDAHGKLRIRELEAWDRFVLLEVIQDGFSIEFRLESQILR